MLLNGSVSKNKEKEKAGLYDKEQRACWGLMFCIDVSDVKIKILKRNQSSQHQGEVERHVDEEWDRWKIKEGVNMSRKEKNKNRGKKGYTVRVLNSWLNTHILNQYVTRSSTRLPVRLHTSFSFSPVCWLSLSFLRAAAAVLLEHKQKQLSGIIKATKICLNRSMKHKQLHTYIHTYIQGAFTVYHSAIEFILQCVQCKGN